MERMKIEKNPLSLMRERAGRNLISLPKMSTGENGFPSPLGRRCREAADEGCAVLLSENQNPHPALSQEERENHFGGLKRHVGRGDWAVGFFIFFIFFASLARAGDLTFTADVDRTTLTMNDTLMLQLTFSGGRLSIPQPSLSSIPGFRATFAGQSQNISYINGQVTSQVVFSFALAPQSPGEHVIPAISMTVGGQTLTTNPIPIKVLSGSAGPAPAGGNTQDTGVAHGGRNLFVTTTVDKKTVTVGEQLTLLFRFYSRAPLLSQPRYQPPDTTGFMSEDLPPQRQYVTILQGVRYQVVELATALFPTSSGKFTIGPAALECNVQDFSDPFGDGFFQNFFHQGQPVTLRSDPLVVSVQPVPEQGRPASFRGDVGRFDMTARFDKKAAQVHEPLTLTVTVSGEGNVKALSAPPLPEIKEFKTYETLSSLNIEKKAGRLQGSKVFTTVMKPEVSGELTFPALSLSFYDPQARTFRTVSSQPLRVRVSPAEPGAPAGPGVSYTSVGEGLKEMGRDIRFIKTSGPVGPQKPPLQDRSWFAVAQFLPGVLFFGLWGGRSLARMGKKSLAPSAARRALKSIKQSQSKGAPSAETLHPIFQNYLAAKLKTSAQGLTPEWTSAQLMGLGHPPAIVKDMETLWNEFDQARFTRTGATDSNWPVRLSALIRALEAKP